MLATTEVNPTNHSRPSGRATSSLDGICGTENRVQLAGWGVTCGFAQKCFHYQNRKR